MFTKGEIIMVENALFRRKKANIQKLLDFGFTKSGGRYFFSCDIADGQFTMTVTVIPDEKVNAQVMDKASGEEYVLHRAADASGPFVGMVRADYERVLSEISDRCFGSEVFKSPQAKELIEYVRSTYGGELEFLWQKFPDNAVWRRSDNKKWYGALLTVSKRKLGLASDEITEIVDLRIKPEDLKNTLDGKRYLTGFHMNKKNWYTILLDCSVSTEELCRRIDESYRLAVK